MPAIEETLLPGISLRFIDSNGIRMRIAEMGEGPVVLFAHGWPESWYSWRHQIKALADAGFHVVVPDMRGYGETEEIWFYVEDACDQQSREAMILIEVNCQ